METILGQIFDKLITESSGIVLVLLLVIAHAWYLNARLWKFTQQKEADSVELSDKHADAALINARAYEGIKVAVENIARGRGR